MIAALVTNLVISQRVERNRYDRILPVISSALVSQFDRPSSYEELLETCRRILCADTCALFLLEDEDNLVLDCIVGIPDFKKEKLRGFGYQNYHTAQGLTPWILRKGSAFNVRNYPDLKERSEGHHLGKWDEIVYDGRREVLFKSLYSIPLIIGSEQIGAAQQPAVLRPCPFTQTTSPAVQCASGFRCSPAQRGRGTEELEMADSRFKKRASPGSKRQGYGARDTGHGFRDLGRGIDD